MDPVIMAMKGYSTLPKYLELETNYQLELDITINTLLGLVLLFYKQK